MAARDKVHKISYTKKKLYTHEIRRCWKNSLLFFLFDLSLKMSSTSSNKATPFIIISLLQRKTLPTPAQHAVSITWQEYLASEAECLGTQKMTRLTCSVPIRDPYRVRRDMSRDDSSFACCTCENRDCAAPCGISSSPWWIRIMTGLQRGEIGRNKTWTTWKLQDVFICGRGVWDTYYAVYNISTGFEMANVSNFLDRGWTYDHKRWRWTAISIDPMEIFHGQHILCTGVW